MCVTSSVSGAGQCAERIAPDDGKKIAGQRGWCSYTLVVAMLWRDHAMMHLRVTIWLLTCDLYVLLLRDHVIWSFNLVFTQTAVDYIA